MGIYIFMVNNKTKNLLIVILALVTFYMIFNNGIVKKENVMVDFNKKEIDLIISHIEKVHNSITYGTGEKSALFTDEIFEVGSGHCGHYSRMLFRELLLLGYKPEIISIITFDKRSHSMLEVTLKSGKKILADATTNILYLNSATEIISNPDILENNIIGTSTKEMYSNKSFWKNIKTFKYLPYLDANLIKDFAQNNIENIIDFKYNTSNYSNEVKVKFNNIHRISSIVIYPFEKNININVSLRCVNEKEKEVIF